MWGKIAALIAVFFILTSSGGYLFAFEHEPLRVLGENESGSESEIPELSVNAEATGAMGELPAPGPVHEKKAHADVTYELSPFTVIGVDSHQETLIDGSSFSRGELTVMKKLSRATTVELRGARESSETASKSCIEAVMKNMVGARTEVTVAGRRDNSENEYTDSLSAGVEHLLGRNTTLGLSAEKALSSDQVENTYTMRIDQTVRKSARIGASVETAENDEENSRKYYANIEKDLGAFGKISGSYGIITDSSMSSIARATYEKELKYRLSLYGSIEQAKTKDTSQKAELGIKQELGSGYLKFQLTHEKPDVQLPEAQKSVFIKFFKEF